MGDNGRPLVIERYNWDKVGAEIARNVIATMGKTRKETDTENDLWVTD